MTLPFDAASFHAALARDHLPWAPALHFARTDSTQARLRLDFAERFEMPGFWRVAIADEQTAGRGRTGAAWLAEPGAALLLTIGAVLHAAPTVLPRASLVAGLALADLLAARTGADVRLKWPNDLMAVVGGRWRKLGGILCERVGGACGDPVWLCGIGLNLTGVPESMRDSAAAWADLAADCLPGRTQLAAEVCMAVRREIDVWMARHGHLDVLRLEQRLAFKGVPIEVDLGPQMGTKTVLLDGLDATGALRVRSLTDGRTGEHAVLVPLSITAAHGNPAWRADAGGANR